jgi:regulator of RNase E activity RraB
MDAYSANGFSLYVYIYITVQIDPNSVQVIEHHLVERAVATAMCHSVPSFKIGLESEIGHKIS